MIVTIGEILIDMVTMQAGRLEQVSRFSRNPGGAVANVAVWLAARGQQVGFIGAVGDDGLGRYLRGALGRWRVDTSHLQVCAGAATTLAFVSLTAAGERDFEFVRGADASLRLDAEAAQYIRRARALHFGSVSLSREPARTAIWQAVEVARDAGLLLSFDPNIRPPLWPDPSQIDEQVWRGIRAADVVKLSDDEATRLTGEPEPAAALDALAGYLGVLERPALLTLTCGAAGSLYLHRPSGRRGHVAAAPVKRVVDTTGAGDAYTATLLASIVGYRKPVAQLDEATIRRAVAHASIAGARAVGRRGAWPR